VPTPAAREREVIQWWRKEEFQGSSCLLDLSTKTAETHRSNIMRKLDLHSVQDLVLYAIKNHIIQVQPPSANRSSREGSIG